MTCVACQHEATVRRYLPVLGEVFFCSSHARTILQSEPAVAAVALGLGA